MVPVDSEASEAAVERGLRSKVRGSEPAPLCFSGQAHPCRPQAVNVCLPRQSRKLATLGTGQVVQSYRFRGSSASC